MSGPGSPHDPPTVAFLPSSCPHDASPALPRRKDEGPRFPTKAAPSLGLTFLASPNATGPIASRPTLSSACGWRTPRRRRDQRSQGKLDSCWLGSQLFPRPGASCPLPPPARRAGPPQPLPGPRRPPPLPPRLDGSRRGGLAGVGGAPCPAPPPQDLVLRHPWRRRGKPSGHGGADWLPLLSSSSLASLAHSLALFFPERGGGGGELRERKINASILLRCAAEHREERSGAKKPSRPPAFHWTALSLLGWAWLGFPPPSAPHPPPLPNAPSAAALLKEEGPPGRFEASGRPSRRGRGERAAAAPCPALPRLRPPSGAPSPVPGCPDPEPAPLPPRGAHASGPSSG